MEQPPVSPKPRPQYTVFIRLPFPRHDFEDPAPVEWDAVKDKALWKLISKASNSKDLDWEGMSAHFGVTLPFLLQQAAWLYERHLEGMRLQMKKLGAATSASSSPKPVLPDEDSAYISPASGLGAPPMSRAGSKDARRLSAINTLKAASQPLGESASSPGTPRSGMPAISRSPSTATVTQSRVSSSNTRQPLPRPFRGSSGSQKRPTLPSRAIDASDEDHRPDDAPLERDPSSGSDSAELPTSTARSSAFRRPQVSKKTFAEAMSSSGDAEDDADDGSGGYLPFASVYKAAREDPSATLRTAPNKQAHNPQTSGGAKYAHASEQPDSLTSSASSAQPDAPGRSDRSSADRPKTARADALSPRHRAQLAAQLSPRHRKSESEGSPSMGSSFSDLDDASVTQSALEDALLSNMQHGSIGMGMGSRMSSLRDVLGKK